MVDPSPPTIARERPDSEDGARLIAATIDELAERYGEDQGGPNVDELAAADATFLVARIDGRAVACGAFRELAPGVVEIKRMYVEPSARRRGLARAILRELERLAREAGVEAVRLETGLRQPEAIALYESEGYERFECWPPIYSEDPLSVCFEKRFAQPAQRASA